MEINIESMNKPRKANYEIPENYLVLNVFQTSPMTPNFFILGKNLKQIGWYGIFYFDGISDTPTSYETFYERNKD